MVDLASMGMNELRAEAKRLGITEKFGSKEKGQEIVLAARKLASRIKPGTPGTIREMAERYLREPIPYSEVLAKVKAHFPAANTTSASLRWYTVQMRKRGEALPDRPYDFPRA